MARVHSLATARREEGPKTFQGVRDAAGGPDIVRDTFVLMSPESGDTRRLTMGYTILYPGCRTSGHTHDDLEEVYFFIRGAGIMIVDGEEIPVQAGDALHIPPRHFHATRNPSPAPLEMLWVLTRVE